jgi:methylated-DNA-[protein]-cysteine S-methyltransferase
MRWNAVIEFPKMKVAVATRDALVVGIKYLPLSDNSKDPDNALAERAVRQLERYRENPDAKFDLPLLIEGSEFQRRVWDAMCAIPRGRTLTYGEMARKLGGMDHEAARAVGQACGDNRLPVVIPCHRVVAADGIGGFSHTASGVHRSTDGYLIDAKRWLLMHEASADAFRLR